MSEVRMPEIPPLPGLPPFPTKFTERDQARLAEIEKRKRALEEDYQRHFLPEVWQAKPAPERHLRWFGGAIGVDWALHALRGVIPREAFQWGLTPDVARAHRFRTEEEYLELTRRQRVNQQLDTILRDIRILAYTGQVFDTIGDLESRFPEIREWSKEEVAYVSSFARSLIGKTPDEILKEAPDPLDITPEMIAAAYAGRPAHITFEQALSSVAFTSNVASIKDILTTVFPPQPVEPMTEEEIQRTRDALTNIQQQENIELGISPEPGETLADSIQRRHELLAKGRDISLRDEKTGTLILGTLTEGNLVWQDDELLGYLDPETQVMFPVAIDGTILRSVFIEESWLEDNVIDPLFVSIMRGGRGFLRWVTTDLPMMFHKLLEARDPLFYRLRGEAKTEELAAKYGASAARQVDAHQEWLARNPHLVPRPEYQVSPFKNPGMLKDPGFVASTIMETALYAITVLGTTIAVTKATGGNLPAGIAAGIGVGAIPEATEMTASLTASGVPYEEAVGWGQIFGFTASGLEVASDLVLLGHVYEPFRGATGGFSDILARHFKNRVLKSVAAGITVQATETMEEMVTSVLHDTIFDIYHDVTWRQYLENMSDVGLRAAIATSPFALWGGGASYLNFKHELSPGLQKKLDDAEAKFEKAGATPEQAQVLAARKVSSLNKADGEEIGKVISEQRDEHVAFMQLPSEVKSTEIEASPLTGVQALQMEQAYLVLVEKEIESVGEQLKQVRESPGGQVGKFDSLIKELETQLSLLQREKNLATSRVAELQGLVKEIPPDSPEMQEVPQAKDIVSIRKELTEERKKLKTTQKDIDEFSSVLPAYEKRFSDLINQGATLFDIRVAKEALLSIRDGLRLAQDDKASIISKIEKLEKSLTAARLDEAVTPDIVGVPIPLKVQKEKLAQADVLLATIPDAAPDSIQEFSTPEGTTFVITNPEGKALAVGETQIKDGKLTLTSLVSDKTRASSKAVERLLSFMELLGVALPNTVQTSRVALRVFKAYQKQRKQDVLDKAVFERFERFKEKLKAMYDHLSQPQAVDGVPTLDRWEAERIATAEGLEADKEIAATIIRPTLKRAELAWNELSGEERLELMKAAKIKKAVRDELVNKDWGDIALSHREKISLAAIPNESISRLKLPHLYDQIYIFSWLEEQTGLPFYSLFRRLELSVGKIHGVRDEMLDIIDKHPEFRTILKDKRAMRRVEQEISSRNPALKIEAPEDITDLERAVADAFEEGFRKVEPYVRYLRFLREYEQTPNLDDVYKAIVGKTELTPAEEAAIKSELQRCIDYYKAGDFDNLWAYVQDKSWGVIGSGYTPWIMIEPGLLHGRLPISATRGAGRLMHRQTVNFPSGMKTLTQRYGTYMKQLFTYFYLRPELTHLDSMLDEVLPKMTSDARDFLIADMRSFVDELQGLPSKDTYRLAFLRRLYRQMIAVVLWPPAMALRNAHQHLVFFPYRTELIRCLVDRPSPHFRELMRLYYKANVEQIAAIRREVLFSDEGSFLPGTDWIVRLVERTSLFGLSENIPRYHSFIAGSSKAYRASLQFMKDRDIKKWERDSGYYALQTTAEQNHAKELLLRKDGVNFVVSGLRDVKNAEAASLYIGQRLAEVTHFVYERAFRGDLEHGESGRLIFNLLTFPRSYVMRMSKQIGKIKNKELPTTERLQAFRDVAMMVIMGAIVSEWLTTITMRPRRAYNPVDIIRWELGGLAIGGATDLSRMISNFMIALTGDAEERERALNAIPGLVSRNAEILIPFYSIFIDSLGAITSVESLDVKGMRQLRSWLDENYTPEDIEKFEASLMERFAMAMLGGHAPEPDIFEQAQKDVIELETSLGYVDDVGRFYLLSDLASGIETSIEGIPDDMLTEEYGWSKLFLYYMDFREQYQEFKRIPTVGDARRDYRRTNIDFNVWLCFWFGNRFTDSLHPPGSQEYLYFIRHMNILLDYYGINAQMHPEYASWRRGAIPKPEA